MEKIGLALILVNTLGLFAISFLLATGHAGFALKFTNIFFFALVFEAFVVVFKS